MADGFKDYMLDKNGTGVGKYATEAGTHSVVDSVLDAYSTQGINVPADVQSALTEMNGLAAGEGAMAGTTVGERRMLRETGQYNPGTVIKRHAELMGFVQERTRDVNTAEARIAFKMKEVELSSSQEGLSFKRASNSITLQTARLALMGAELELDMAERNHGLLAFSAEHERRVDEGYVRIANIQTQNLVDVVNSRDPMQIEAVFGPGTTPNEALSMLKRRLKDEQGLNAAVSEADAEAELWNTDQILQNHKPEDINGMLNGTVPMPEGLSTSQLLSARDEGTRRQIAAQELETAAIGADINNEVVRRQLIGLKLGAMPLADLNVLYEAALANPNTPFEMDGLGVEFSGQEIANALVPLRQSLLKRQQERVATSVQRSVTRGFLEQADNLMGSIEAAFDIVPWHIKQSVENHVARINAQLALPDGAGEAKAAKLAEEMMEVIEGGLDDEKLTKDQKAAIMSGRNVSEGQYSEGLNDFFTNSSIRGQMSPIGKVLAQQMEAISGTELNPQAATNFIKALTAEGDFRETTAAALDLIGLTIKQFEGALEDSYRLLKMNTASRLMSDPDFLGDAFTPEAAQDISEMFGQIMGKEYEQRGSPGYRGSDTPEAPMLFMSDILDGLQTIGHVHGVSSELMSKFQQSMSGQDALPYFQTASGHPSPAEAAMFNLYAQLQGRSTGFGPGSIALADAPASVESMLSRQMANTMVGRHNLGQPPGMKQISYLLGQLFRQEDSSSAPISGFMGVAPPAINYKPFAARKEQNPEVSMEAARFVAQTQLTRSQRDVTLADSILGLLGGGNVGSDAYGPTLEELEDHLRSKGLLAKEQ